jgi:hypothetical protein
MKANRYPQHRTRHDCRNRVVPDERLHIAPNNSLESVTPQQNQVSANDYANRCGEQTALLKHEIAFCRAVPLIMVPLQ